jgi:hypothetical protein
MAVLRLATAARNAAADAVVDLCDAGAGAATVKIYTGSQPTTGNDTETGSLLATITLADPAFGSASTGVATATDPVSVNASGTGTAGWFRLEDSTGANIFDGDCTATGGGGTMTLSTTSLVSGSPVDITSFTVTMPAS